MLHYTVTVISDIQRHLVAYVLNTIKSIVREIIPRNPRKSVSPFLMLYDEILLVLTKTSSCAFLRT